MDNIEKDLEAILIDNAPKKLISKSRLLQFIQCERLGYISYKDPKSVPKPSLSSLRTMRQGTEVGLEAQKLYPEGKLVNFPAYLMGEAIEATKELIKEHKTLFEATFEFNGVVARVDILNQTEDGIELIEVKSGTNVTEEYINDLSVQYYILKNLGFKISKVYILNINSKNYDGANLFKYNDLFEEVEANWDFIEDSISEYKQVLQKDNAPNIQIGSHCSDPHDCPFFEQCKKRNNIPDISVLDIPNSRKKWKHIAENKLNLLDVVGEKWNPSQARMIKAHLEDRIIINKNPILAFLYSAKYPLHHLDFETEQRAIPRIQGTRPYQQVVFQYSLHREEADGSLFWTDYLVESESDERELIIKKMLSELGQEGSIISYNASFEKTRIKELAEDYPAYKDQLMALIDRFLDPLEIFKEAIYHPEFKGSFSIKKVAPAILGSSASYLNLNVQDGIMAQEFFELILKEKDEVKKQGLIRDLKEYCKQDTYLMVLLIRWLRDQVKEESFLEVSSY